MTGSSRSPRRGRPDAALSALHLLDDFLVILQVVCVDNRRELGIRDALERSSAEDYEGGDGRVQQAAMQDCAAHSACSTCEDDLHFEDIEK